jgi:hypothetical protein
MTCRLAVTANMMPEKSSLVLQKSQVSAKVRKLLYFKRFPRFEISSVDASGGRMNREFCHNPAAGASAGVRFSLAAGTRV